jgi:GNAT superfamily N-acetyltransferase
MTAERPEVVPLEDVPAAEVLALLETCLGPGAVTRDEAFWRWKHEASPFGRSIGLVATAGGRPVALRAFLRWRWAAAGRTEEAFRAVDTATHPAWRRRGLFRRLTLELAERARGEDAAFVFNTPNPRSRRGYLAMGWEDVGRVPLRVRLRRPGRVLGRALAAGRGRGGAGGGAESPPLAGLRPVSELLDEPALPGFLAAWGAGERRLHTPRSPEYLRWRYAAAPGLSYRACWHLEGSSGAAAVVRSRLRRGLAEASLSELLVTPDPAGRAAARRLLERLGHLPGPDYLAAAAAPDSAEHRALREAGWRPLPLGPRLVARPLRISAPDPRERASWRLSAGDLELF